MLFESRWQIKNWYKKSWKYSKANEKNRIEEKQRKIEKFMKLPPSSFIHDLIIRIIVNVALNPLSCQSKLGDDDDELS